MVVNISTAYVSNLIIVNQNNLNDVVLELQNNSKNITDTSDRKLFFDGIYRGISFLLELNKFDLVEKFLFSCIDSFDNSYTKYFYFLSMKAFYMKNNENIIWEFLKRYLNQFEEKDEIWYFGEACVLNLQFDKGNRTVEQIKLIENNIINLKKFWEG